MVFNYIGNKSHDVRSPYRIDSFILPFVSSVSDLGVVKLDPSAEFFIQFRLAK